MLVYETVITKCSNHSRQRSFNSSTYLTKSIRRAVAPANLGLTQFATNNEHEHSEYCICRRLPAEPGIRPIEPPWKLFEAWNETQETSTQELSVRPSPLMHVITSSGSVDLNNTSDFFSSSFLRMMGYYRKILTVNPDEGYKKPWDDWKPRAFDMLHREFQPVSK